MASNRASLFYVQFLAQRNGRYEYEPMLTAYHHAVVSLEHISHLTIPSLVRSASLSIVKSMQKCELKTDMLKTCKTTKLLLRICSKLHLRPKLGTKL